MDGLGWKRRAQVDEPRHDEAEIIHPRRSSFQVG